MLLKDLIKTVKVTKYHLPKSAESKPAVERGLTLSLMKKLATKRLEDPLLWNTSVLARIYKIDEQYLDNILDYVKVYTYYIDSYKDDFVKLLDMQYVADAKKIQTKPELFPELKRINFVIEQNSPESKSMDAKR